MPTSETVMKNNDIVQEILFEKLQDLTVIYEIEF